MKQVITSIVIGTATALTLIGILEIKNVIAGSKKNQYSTPYVIVFDDEESLEKNIEICRADDNCMDILHFEEVVIEDKENTDGKSVESESLSKLNLEVRKRISQGPCHSLCNDSITQEGVPACLTCLNQVAEGVNCDDPSTDLDLTICKGASL